MVRRGCRPRPRRGCRGDGPPGGDSRGRRHDRRRAEALSAGVRDPGDTMLMYGKTMFMVEIARAFRPEASLWSTQGVFEGTVTYAAGLSTSGGLTVWLRDIVGRDFEALIDEAAQTPPGADGLVVLPFFGVARSPIFDAQARGAIFGLTLSHGRGHLYRAVLEGSAYEVRHNLEVMKAAGALPEQSPWRTSSRSAARTSTGSTRASNPTRRRRHEERALDPGRVRRDRPPAGHSRRDDRVELRRRDARGRRIGARGGRRALERAGGDSRARRERARPIRRAVPGLSIALPRNGRAGPRARAGLGGDRRGGPRRGRPLLIRDAASGRS